MDSKENEVIKAIKADDNHFMEQWLENGGNVNMKIGAEEKPLLNVAAENYAKEVAYLLAHSNGKKLLDKDAVDVNGNNALAALCVAPEKPQSNTVLDDHEYVTKSSMAKILITGGIRVNQRNNEGLTAIDLAAENFVDGFDKALSKFRDDSFVEGGRKERLERFIDDGVDVNVKSYGRTALHVSALEQSKENVEFLLEKGADSSMLDRNGRTPLDVARSLANSSGSSPIASLRQTLAKEQQNRKEFANWLEAHLIFLEKQKLESILLPAEPMPKVVATHSTELEEPAVRHVKTEQEKLDTHFRHAANNGYLDELATHLENGADINSVNANGTSALHCAVTMGNTDCVSFLIENGIDLNLQDYGGKTALHIAASHVRVEIVEMLIAAGANPNLLDDEEKLASECVRTPSDFGRYMAQQRGDEIEDERCRDVLRFASERYKLEQSVSTQNASEVKPAKRSKL